MNTEHKIAQDALNKQMAALVKKLNANKSKAKLIYCPETDSTIYISDASKNSKR